jgi:hypothetical protein
MYQPNLIAIIVAGIIPMAVGSLWYGPAFGGLWMKLTGRTEEEIRESMKPIKMYVVTFIMALVTAWVLAQLIQLRAEAFTVDGFFSGIQIAFFVWLGFVITIGYQAVAFENQKVTLYLLNMAYNLVSLVAMGALLGVWR